MNTTVKKYAFVIIFVMFASVFSSIASTFDSEESTGINDYARITDVDYTAVLVDEPDAEAKIVVTERLTFDIHAASEDNLFWELWRALPESTTDGLKTEYKVNYVKQIFDDGSTKNYSESSKLYWDDYDYINTSDGYGPGKWYYSQGPYNEYLRQYECVLFYIDGTYRDELVFELQYEMTNAAFRYADCSELYLCMYSEESIRHLDSFRAEILIANKDMPSKEFYYANTYGTKNNTFEYTESDTLNPGYHTFLMELDVYDLKFDKFTEFLEFDLVAFGEDKHKFTDYAPENFYYNDVALDEIKELQDAYFEEFESIPSKKNIIFMTLVALSIFIINKTKKFKKEIQEKYQFYTPDQEIQYFRDIPSDLDANFASHLVFCKDKKEFNNENSSDPRDGYSAAMLNLVRKKYIELERIDSNRDWIKQNIKIVIKYNPSIHKKAPMYSNDSNDPFKNINPNNPIALAKASLQRSFDAASSQDGEPKEILEPLSPTEELYFNLIIRYATSGEISLKTFQANIQKDYERTDTFVKSFNETVKEIGVNYGYFQKVKYKQPRNEIKLVSILYTYIIPFFTFFFLAISLATRIGAAYGGYFIFIITSILCGSHLRKIAPKYILLTQKGEDEYQKWRGLYNFLNSETLMNERTLIELPIWEKYLVYATAFGISQKVIKALQIRCPQLANSTLLSNDFYRSSNFRSSSRSFRTAVKSASYTARSGMYSSGYSGGRGGGGGGGGH